MQKEKAVPPLPGGSGSAPLELNEKAGFAVAIDGPMGVGKSTVAKMLAQMLNMTYIDTGAMYRAVTFYNIQRGTNLALNGELEKSLPDINIDIRNIDGLQRIYLNGQDVTDLIRTQEISDITSRIVAINAAVREKLVAQQRQIAEKGEVVMDGRDIGSHVLPWAQLKIYLDAAPEIRARRRCLELEDKGQLADFAKVLQETKIRDDRDKTRLISPLVQTKDAIYIDTANMTQQQVAEKIAEYVLQKKAEENLHAL